MTFGQPSTDGLDHHVPRWLHSVRTGLHTLDLVDRVVDDLPVRRRHRLKSTFAAGALDFLDDALGEPTECGSALLPVAADIHQNPVRPVLRLTLHEGPGEVLHRGERRSAWPDQQPEVVTDGRYLDRVLVDFGEADGGIQPELPDETGKELLSSLSLLVQCQ